MDLNYLYQCHQFSLFMSDNAATEEVRCVHRDLATGYARQIADAKKTVSMIAGR